MSNPSDESAPARADLLVVGGGIHGLFAAYDAAARGLSVVLVERADFGSGLSFNHQRTIHGGLRALEHGQVGKVRQQIAERRTWARIAPHLLRPLPFLIGTYRWTRRSRWMLKAGFAAYDLLGRHRNAQVSSELHLPKARLESAAATKRLFQGVDETGLTGGAIYYDYQTTHPDRLTWSVAMAATRAGARLLNYTTALGPRQAGSATGRTRLRDERTGSEFDVEAGVTLLAPGSQLGPLMSSFGLSGAPPLVRAMNLLLDRPARDIATAARSASGRMLTSVPWRGYVLAGTHQSNEAVDAGETAPPPAAVTAFLDELNAAFPKLHASLADVRMIHHGLTPASMNGGRLDLLAEPRLIGGGKGATVIALVGVKYTTARWAAERAVDAVCEALGKPRGRCTTALTTLPHAGIADVEGRLVETARALGVDVARDVLEHLASWYGTEASDVVAHAAAANLLDRLDASTPVIAGEIAYAADRSQTVHLSDAVLRRTALGSAGHPGAAALTRAAAVMGARLRWSPERQADEIGRLEGVYRFTSP